MLDYRRTIRLYYDYVMTCYKKMPLVMVKGQNTKLKDAQGKEYLDFFSGYVVSGLGHCPKRVVEAIREQAETLIHVPNSFYHEWQGRLAEQIIQHAFPGKVFFANSGTEAIEGAIKLARHFGHPDRWEIITMEKSFHGRTYGALSATGQSHFHEGVGPILPGFVTVPFNDIEAVKKAVTPKTIAILLELVQGEGGVRIAEIPYVRALRQLCDERNLLLICDEVQTGIGRTGKMFCFKHYDVTPDIMTLAKSIGGGFPLGAVVGGKKVQDVFKPGVHASTFGGNPLACAAGLATFETLEKDRLLENCFLMGAALMRKLLQMKKNHPRIVKDARGMGLLCALELAVPAQPVYEACLKEGLYINATQDTILRMAPPLTIREKEINWAMDILERILTQQESSLQTATQ